MANVHHITGFESGALIDDHEVYDYVGTIAIATTTPLTGAYSLRVNPVGTAVGYARFGRPAANGTTAINNAGGSPFNIGFKFRADTLPASGSEEIAVVMTAATSYVAALRVTSAGKLQIYNNNGTTQTGSDSVRALTAGVPYYIEFRVANGANGACAASVRINGVEECSTSTGTFSVNADALDFHAVGKRTNRNGQDVNFVYDDLVQSDSFFCAATDTEALWPQVTALAPTGAGTYAQLTAGTGASDYTQVNETAPDGSTTYVRSATSGHVSTFLTQTCASAGITGTIHAVQAQIRQIRQGASASAQLRVRSGGVDYDSTAISISSYTTLHRVMEVEPTSGDPWNATLVDQVEVGMVATVVASTGPRLSWASKKVLYSPAAPTGGARRMIGSPFRLAGAGGLAA